MEAKRHPGTGGRCRLIKRCPAWPWRSTAIRTTIDAVRAWIEALTRLLAAFEARYPDCQVTVEEVSIGDPYAALRHGRVDAVFTWLAVDEPDLTAGPAIDHRDRVLAVANGHPLAARQSVSAEDLAGYELPRPEPPLPKALYDAIVPPHTPSGRPTRRTCIVHSMQELYALVASGRIVHPTATSLPLLQRADITLILITDMPAFALGPIW